MRKQKTIKIDDREITVKELRVKDIRRVLDGFDDIKGLEALLPLAADITIEQMDDYAPSEIAVIWTAFYEVNDFFFTKIKESGILKTLKNSILKDLMSAFSSSLQAATDTKT